MDAVLVSQPDIAQAVAFGVPDEKYGEEVRTTNWTGKFELSNRVGSGFRRDSNSNPIIKLFQP